MDTSNEEWQGRLRTQYEIEEREKREKRQKEIDKYLPKKHK